MPVDAVFSWYLLLLIMHLYVFIPIKMLGHACSALGSACFSNSPFELNYKPSNDQDLLFYLVVTSSAYSACSFLPVTAPVSARRTGGQ